MINRSYNDIEPLKGGTVCIELTGYENPKKDWEVLFMAIAVLASQRCEANVVAKEGCVIVRDKQVNLKALKEITHKSRFLAMATVVILNS